MNNTPNTNPHTPLPPITPGQARIGIFDSGYGGLIDWVQLTAHAIRNHLNNK